jgi:hypothetical protein
VCSYDAVSLFYLELYVKLSIYLSIYLSLYILPLALRKVIYLSIYVSKGSETALHECVSVADALIWTCCFLLKVSG